MGRFKKFVHSIFKDSHSGHHHHHHHHHKKKHHHHHHHDSPCPPLPWPPIPPCPPCPIDPGRHCARVKVDRVLAEELFTCSEPSGPCDLGMAFPPGSVLTGTIEVTVLSCTPVITGPRNPIEVDIVFLIEKELTVTEPDGTTIPLGFTFHALCRESFGPVKLGNINPNRIRCMVFDIRSVTANIDFICSNPAFGGHATLAEQLEIVLVIKLFVEEQLDVALCPSHPHDDPDDDDEHHDHHHHDDPDDGQEHPHDDEYEHHHEQHHHHDDWDDGDDHHHHNHELEKDTEPDHELERVGQ